MGPGKESCRVPEASLEAAWVGQGRDHCKSGQGREVVGSEIKFRSTASGLTIDLVLRYGTGGSESRWLLGLIEQRINY